MNNKPCDNRREAIAVLILGELESSAADELRHHLAGCRGCDALYQAMAAEEATIRSSFEAIAEQSKAVEDSLVQQINKHRMPRSVVWAMCMNWLWAGSKLRRISAVAAAVLIVGALVTVKMLTEDEVPAKDNSLAPQVHRPTLDEKMQIRQNERKLEQQLKLTDQMFANGDVTGLISMLETGQWESKIAAANYLGQIGNLEAMEALQEFVALWVGPEDDNPFAKAIKQINNNLAMNESQLEPSEQPGRSGQLQGTELETEPQYILSGFITDAETGDPVTDAQVAIHIRQIYTTQTDANGFYHFDKIGKDGNYRIRIQSKDYIGITDYDRMPVVNLNRNAQKTKNFRLHRACQIEVKVVDEQGDPIEDARLVVTSLADDKSREIGDSRYSHKTDSDGLILLGGIEPSDAAYLITATHRVKGPVVERNGVKHELTRWDYAAGYLTVTLSDPNVIETGEIALRKGFDVKGYAEYADGVPAHGLSISAKPRWWHCNYCPPIVPIDPNGYFTLTQIVPEQYGLHIHIPYGQGSRSFAVSQMELPTEDELIYVRVPSKSPGSLASISGRITYLGEKKPSHVEISAYSPAGGHNETTVEGGQETFAVDSLEPGTYTLRFTGDGIEEKVLKDVTAPSSDLEVELEYTDSAKPVLQGIVVRADTEQPIAKFKARARKLQTLRGPHYVQSDRWTEFVNSQARFSLDTVGPGVYEVQVAAEGLAWSWSEQINTDDNKSVTIQLTAGGAIKGKVVGENAQPIPNATVIPLSKASGTMPRTNALFASTNGSVKTDPNGEFVLDNLVPGSESIKVTHSAYCFAIERGIEVAEGQTTTGIEVALSKGGSIEGYVFNTQGKPEPAVTLLFQDESGYGSTGSEEAGRLATAVTDSNGFYHVDSLPEQMCYVRRSNSWSSLGVVNRAIVPQNGETLRLDFGGLPIVDGLLAPDGQPLADVRVLLGGIFSRYSRVFNCYVRTDRGGRFSFAGIPAGRYGVYYEVPTKRGEWTKVAVIETTGQDTDLGIVPRQTGRVLISLVPSEAGEPLDDLTIHLQEGTKFWAPSAGTVSRPTKPGEPYIVTNVPPGEYTIAAIRSDNVRIRQPIELRPDQQELKVTLTALSGTAKVSGRFISDSQQPLVMWRSDEKVIAHVYPSDGEFYRVENLPAGEYTIGNYFIGNRAPLMIFTLADGEAKVVDIDTSNFSTLQMASLVAQVVGSDGIPLTAAEVWLERRGQQISPVTSSDEGYFLVAEPGDYTLHAAGPGYEEATRHVCLEAGNIAQRTTERSTVLVRLQKK